MEAIAKDELWDFSSLNAFVHQPAPDPVAVPGLPEVLSAGKLPTKPFENGLQWAHCLDIYAKYRAFWYPWELDGQLPRLLQRRLPEVWSPGLPPDSRRRHQRHPAPPLPPPPTREVPEWQISTQLVEAAREASIVVSGKDERVLQPLEQLRRRSSLRSCSLLRRVRIRKYGKHNCLALRRVGKDKGRKPRARTEGASSLAAWK